MKLCPLCQAEYSDDNKHCTADGELLIYLQTQEDRLLGTVFNERYRIEEKIGEGGMGAVYRATQDLIGRAVAIKVLQRDLATDKKAVQRFFNEARVVSKLRHPNTITLFDFGQSDSGDLFIAMELMTGKDLADFIVDGPPTLAEIIEVSDQICLSLEEAHDQGIIHRDLKPENIFIDRVASRNIVKVLDFGIAKVRDSEEHLTRTGTIFGTPAYMSPEQARGLDVDHRSDLYSLGIILYEMLSGAPPFHGDRPMQIALQHVTTNPAPIIDMSIYRPLPAQLSALVMDLLEKNPAKRPETASRIRDRLLRVGRTMPDISVTLRDGQQPRVRVLAKPSTQPEPWMGDDPADKRVRTELFTPAQNDIPIDVDLEPTAKPKKNHGKPSNEERGVNNPRPSPRKRKPANPYPAQVMPTIILDPEPETELLPIVEPVSATTDPTEDILIDFQFLSRRPLYVGIGLISALAIAVAIALLSDSPERGQEESDVGSVAELDPSTTTTTTEPDTETADTSQERDEELRAARERLTGAISNAQNIIHTNTSLNSNTSLQTDTAFRTGAIETTEVPGRDPVSRRRSEQRRERSRATRSEPETDPDELTVVPPPEAEQSQQIATIDDQPVDETAAPFIAPIESDHTDDNDDDDDDDDDDDEQSLGRRPVQLQSPLTIP